MKKLDLQGQWLLESVDGSYACSAEIPGDTHTALQQSQLIGDPFYANNELALQKLNRMDWVFSRNFELPHDFLDFGQIYLHADSLDTICSIKINGVLAAESRNMFVPLDVPVKQFLKHGRNVLEIHIASAENYAKQLSETLPYPIPAPDAPVFSPHRNLVRKTQCHGGWDWGPCFMVSGIYGQIFLSAADKGFMKAAYIRQEPAGENFLAHITLEYEALSSGSLAVEASLEGQPAAQRHFDVAQGPNKLQFSLTVQRPELWYPAGYGLQRLYSLSLKTEEWQTVKKIGFRILEVVTQPDRHGLSMAFRVNGQTIFAKGANWIPAHSFPGSQSPALYRNLLESAKEAHMNMIRVWGGGQYENELFYGLCDELGLLVWHDMMFSCGLYPASQDFLSNVEQEVSAQIKRLMHRPSIALWCGNNECLGSLTWYKESKEHRDRYLVDYDRLYHGVIEKTVTALDPSRLYWPSSPSAGPADYSDTWHQDGKGDMHYWSVWHEGKSFASYYEITPRFCSEFGFQSFPSLSTVKSYAPEDQLNLTSPIMEHHQKNRRGNTIIIESISRYFRFPRNFEQMLYLSQIQQGLAMKTAVEYWRSLFPVCCGALYWQLNDCWPVASWSSIEFGGKWKALHYMAKRFFAPASIAGYIKDETVFVVVAADLAVAGQGCIELVNFEGRLLRKKEFKTAGQGALLVYSAPLAEFEPREELFLKMSFTSEQGKTVENFLFLKPPKQCRLQKAAITLVEREPNIFELSTDKPAFFVVLDAGPAAGRFNDNAFLLCPHEPKKAVFKPFNPKDGLTAAKNDITIYHLRNTY